MNVQLKMTDARRRVLEAGTLVAIRTVVPAEITYHGRRIPQATVYSRIRVAK